MPLRRWAPIVTVTLLTAAGALAQVRLGSVRGIVTDANGAVMPDVAIRVTNSATNVSNATSTTSAGVYSLTNLPVGDYKLEAEARGFKKHVQENVVVATGATSALNITMELGDVQQTVTVTETQAPLLQTETATLSTNVERRVVMDLPLQVSGGRRQAEDFIRLTPGVTGDTFSKSYNGSPEMSNASVVDGVPYTLAEVPGRFRDFSPPFEAIDEFQFANTLYPAEVGRTFGAANYTFKSGSNSFHGNAFEFIRNQVLDARGFFNRTKAITRQNEFGGSLGGPVIKNRTFFFGTYSGFYIRGGAPIRPFVTLPTPAFRQGNFSALRDASGLIQLYDPATTRASGNTFARDVFPGNIIPASRVDPLARRVMDLMPQPDDPNAIVGNFLSRSESLSNQHVAMWKVDHNFTSAHRVSYSHWRSFRPLSPGIQQLGKDQALDPGWPGGGIFEGFRINYDWTMSPRTLNHFAYGFSGNRNIGRGYDPRNGVDILPVPGLPSQVVGVTAFNIPGHPKFGNAGESGDRRNDHNYFFTDTVSYLRGRHQFKFGGEVWAQSFRNFNSTQGGGTAGNFFFSNLHTDNPASPTYGRAGYGFASFFLGQVNSLQRLVGPAERTFRMPYFGFFVSDTVQLRPRLTMNIGLRYDLALPWRDKDPNRVSAADLSLPNPGAGNRPGVYVYGNDRVIPPAHKTEFGPRISFTYQLTPKTVIRTGYAILYAVSNAGTTGATQFGNGFDAGFTDTINLSDLTNGVQPLRILGQGFPAYTGTLPNQGPTLKNDQLADYYNRTGGRQTDMQTWTFNIQREIPWEIVIDTGYVGNVGHHLASGLENLNQVPFEFLRLGPVLTQPITSEAARNAGISAPYAGFTGTVAQALRPYPQYIGINNAFQPSSNSNYHAWQTKVQKRFSDGLAFLTSYTLSKNISDTSQSGFATFNAGARDVANRRLERALTVHDRTHVLVGSLVYELPLGKSSTGAAAKVLKGWQASAIARYASGTPIGIGGGGPIPLFSGGNRPHRVANVSSRSSISAGSFDPAQHSYLNPDAFSQPAQFTLGTGARTEPNLRNFAQLNEDLTLLKRTYLTEVANVEFRAEFFNIFNRVVFGGPSSNFNDRTNYGRIFGVANTPRQIQFGLRLNF